MQANKRKGTLRLILLSGDSSERDLVAQYNKKNNWEFLSLAYKQREQRSLRWCNAFLYCTFIRNKKTGKFSWETRLIVNFVMINNHKTPVKRFFSMALTKIKMIQSMSIINKNSIIFIVTLLFKCSRLPIYSATYKE